MNLSRMKEEFLQLVSMDSISFDERKAADWLIGKLKELGFAVQEDAAGAKIGGTAGNIYGFLKGTLPGEPILFSAHMDVVQPGIGKRASFFEEGRIHSAGDTVLGADDFCGIVEILEGVRHLLEEKCARRDIEVLFTVAEEVYGKGAAVFDYRKVRAKEAYVLDLSGPVGTVAVKAPTIISVQAALVGAAAHAGFEPEQGVNAIAAMSRFISRVAQGRVDEETTVNIGTIAGGMQTNIVPERCACRGEVRSYSHEKALQCVEQLKSMLAETAAETGTADLFESEIHIRAYQVKQSHPTVQRFVRACHALGYAGELVSTFGGSDNNHFLPQGITGIVLSCGMYQVHSMKEYTTFADLENGARLVAELASDKTNA